jgi:hypothetical protein
MNERIKQLAEQAGWGKGETHDDCIQCSPFDKEKFAELIVQECAKIADENECEWIGGNILTHFGVKE